LHLDLVGRRRGGHGVLIKAAIVSVGALEHVGQLLELQPSHGRLLFNRVVPGVVLLPVGHVSRIGVDV